MQKNNQSGFSLIELLLVLIIICVIASISIHYFYQAKIAAENNSAVTTLSIIRQNEVIHFAQNQRYGRLDEINILHGNLGNLQSDLSLTRGLFTYELTTSGGTPTASDQKNLSGDYLITATRPNGAALPYVYTMDQSGRILKVLPEPGAIDQ